MKKVLAFSIVVAFVVVGCMSEEQKAEEQAKNEEMVDAKVDEIMEKVDESSPVKEVEADSASEEMPDSASVD